MFWVLQERYVNALAKLLSSEVDENQGEEFYDYDDEPEYDDEGETYDGESEDLNASTWDQYFPNRPRPSDLWLAAHEGEDVRPPVSYRGNTALEMFNPEFYRNGNSLMRNGKCSWIA